MKKVEAEAEEGEEAEVAEELELLADFGADMAIAGMLFREFVGVGVDIGESEFGFAEGLHDLEYVQRPAAFFDF
jgi:hypothetical protein